MCGVLAFRGAISLTQAQSLLQLLIHRGQDASGLAWVDRYGVHQRSKTKGPPSSLSPPSEEVKIFIGSTRYPTIGNRTGEVSTEEFAQPFSFQTSLGTLSLAHNGNITNLHELSDRVYQSDAEFLTERLGTLINKTKDLSKSLVELCDVVDGAFSIVGILGDELFCFRDPRGIRPLTYGTTEFHSVVSSESICLQQAGVTDVRDVKPGELIVFHNDGSYTSSLLIENQKPSHCYFEYVYFASSVSRLEQKNVYDVRLKLGEELGRVLKENGVADQIDYIVPVPDTSKAACMTISETIGVPLREAIMKNRSSMRTFIMPGIDKRELAAKAKYLFIDSFIKGKRLLIVDDSIVRGFTSIFLVNLLRGRGAKEVHVAVTCPPQRFACYYGVDFGTDTELIARNGTSIDEVRKKINADSLTYLPINGLKRAIGIDSLCLACLNGEYPTPYGQKIRLLLSEGKLSPDKVHYEVGHLA